MDIESERQRAFSVWLRTGRLAAVTTPDGIQLKYNPWHDWQNGRFTFAGSGRYSGGRMGGGFTGGGGGSFGGGGASGKWGLPDKRSERPASRTVTISTAKRSASPALAPGRASPSAHLKTQRHVSRDVSLARSAIAGGTEAAADRKPTAPPETRRVLRNGYEYQIDTQGRTRSVSGTLTPSTEKRRSRSTQQRAGGSNRRPNDDGGHYIAPRFNGPTDAFNHFAQDRNFNRGGYRLLEDQWAKDIRSGKQVSVRISASYDG